MPWRVFKRKVLRPHVPFKAEPCHGPGTLPASRWAGFLPPFSPWSRRRVVPGSRLSTAPLPKRVLPALDLHPLSFPSPSHQLATPPAHLWLPHLPVLPMLEQASGATLLLRERMEDTRPDGKVRLSQWQPPPVPKVTVT